MLLSVRAGLGKNGKSGSFFVCENGYPPPHLKEYFAGKVFRMNSMQRHGGCKIFILNKLSIKYSF